MALFSRRHGVPRRDTSTDRKTDRLGMVWPCFHAVTASPAGTRRLTGKQTGLGWYGPVFTPSRRPPAGTPRLIRKSTVSYSNLFWRTGTGSPERVDRDPVHLRQLAGAALNSGTSQRRSTPAGPMRKTPAYKTSADRLWSAGLCCPCTHGVGFGPDPL